MLRDIVDEDDIMYGYGNGFFASIPEGAEILVQVDGSKEPTEGFLPITERNAANVEKFFDSGILAFTYEGKAKDGESDINVAIFANSLTHKVHQRDEYAYISNFLFANQLGEDYTPSYAIVEGNDATWDSNSGADLSFTVNSDAATGVAVNGEALAAENYTIEGNTSTLKADFLNTLKGGEKAITILFADGAAEGTFTVSHKSPATGDSFNAMLWICLMGMTAMAGAALCVKKQKA